MKLLRILFVLCLAGLISSCVPSKGLIYGTNFDYDIDADFSKLKRYTWLPLPVTAKFDPLNAKRFKNEIDKNLQARGLVDTQNNPDFLIKGRFTLVKQMDTTSGPADYGIYPEGLLLLVFLNPDTQETIWWGETRLRVKPEMTPIEKEKLVSDSVSAVLGNFPPPPSN